MDVEEQEGDRLLSRSKVSLLTRATQGIFDLRVQTTEGGKVMAETLRWNGEFYE